MPEFRLKPEAEDDLAAIWRWTRAQWSPAQADAYNDLLTDAMKMLADDPARGQSVSDVSAGLWRRRCEGHVIFYRPATHGIDVVRVLHGRMDFPSHLKDE